MDLIAIIFLTIGAFLAFLTAGVFLAFLLKSNHDKKKTERLSLLKRTNFQKLLLTLENILVSFNKKKIGALIVLVKEREDISHLIYREGIYLDAMPSVELLRNIFNKKTELHDGAIIINQQYRITNASVLFALSSEKKSPNVISSKLSGARHNAALFLTEKSNALAIVVSETSGKISFFKKKERIEIGKKVKLKTVLKAIKNYWNEN